VCLIERHHFVHLAEHCTDQSSDAKLFRIVVAAWQAAPINRNIAIISLPSLVDFPTVSTVKYRLD
jgi:hypothetical protein